MIVLMVTATSGRSQVGFAKVAAANVFPYLVAGSDGTKFSGGIGGPVLVNLPGDRQITVIPVDSAVGIGKRRRCAEQ